jgi:hypothetical protein
MNEQILINVTPQETRVAVTEMGTVLGTSVGVRLSIQGGAPLILRAVTVVLILTGVRLLFP